MKSTKKLLALLLSAILLLSLLPAAFAAEVEGDGAADGGNEVVPTDNFTLTINGTSAGRKYEIYQIFTGTLHTEPATDGTPATTYLSDLKYGDAWTAAGKKGTAVSDEDITDFGKDAPGHWKRLNTKNNGAPKAYGEAVECAAGATSVAFTNLPAGYYIVIEVTESNKIEAGETYSAAIVEVVKDTTASTKPGTASSYKKVKDTNDSQGSTYSAWQDSADYDIGDDVPFQLTAVVGSDYAKYPADRDYRLTFHDEQSEGLTFNSESVRVYLDTVSDDKLIASTHYEVKTTGLADKCTFEIYFANLKAIDGVKAESKIIVEYTSRLNKNAQIGSKGNPNEMHITFSNNPNSDQPEEGGKTPVNKVIVFTYRLDVYKMDGTQADAADHAPLPGATFALYKKVNGEYTKEIGTIESKNAELGVIFRFSGLDDGEYKLVEVKAPDGYNTAEDVYFTITASHDENSNDPKLINLGCKYRSGETGDANEITGELTGLHDGSILIDVLNYRGNTLPSTGGMGTTVFYVLGSILAVGAAILLVSKKRMNGAR